MLPFGEPLSTFIAIKYWMRELRRCRTSYQDEHRSGRSIVLSMPDIIKKSTNCTQGQFRIEYGHINHLIFTTTKIWLTKSHIFYI